MADRDSRESFGEWIDSWGWHLVIRLFAMALNPVRLGIAVAALLLIVAWGSILDAIWIAANHGIPSDAVIYAVSETPVPETIESKSGIFDEWVTFEALFVNRAALALSRGSIFDSEPQDQRVGIAPPYPPQSGLELTRRAVRGAGFLPAMRYMLAGCAWLLAAHWGFSILFFAGVLVIGSVAAGAIARYTGLVIARDQPPTLRQVYEFVKRHRYRFIFAPVIPVIFALLALIALALLGLILAIPWLGDLLMGILFPLTLLIGAIIVFSLMAAFCAAALAWPRIAVDAADAFDALSYPPRLLTMHPVRALIYVIATVWYGAVCWLLFRVLVLLAIWATLFGLSWIAGESIVLATDQISFDAVWRAPSLEAVLGGSLDGNGGEAISASLISIWLRLAVAMLWAYPFTYVVCASTIIYMLLRRSADTTSLCEIYLELLEDGDAGSKGTNPSGAGVALPVIGNSQTT